MIFKKKKNYIYIFLVKLIKKYFLIFAITCFLSIILGFKFSEVNARYKTTTFILLPKFTEFLKLSYFLNIKENKIELAQILQEEYNKNLISTIKLGNLNSIIIDKDIQNSSFKFLKIYKNIHTIIDANFEDKNLKISIIHSHNENIRNIIFNYLNRALEENNKLFLDNLNILDKIKKIKNNNNLIDELDYSKLINFSSKALKPKIVKKISIPIFHSVLWFVFINLFLIILLIFFLENLKNSHK